MEEQLTQLGIGGAAIGVIFLIVKMFLQHLKDEREDRSKILVGLSANIVGLSANIVANSKLTEGVGGTLHEVKQTMHEVKKSLEEHNEFVRNSVR